MKRKNKMSLLLGFGLCFSLAGCGNKGMISVGAIEPSIRQVTSRHDKYILDDATLSETDQKTYLLTSELLLRILDEAKK